MRTLYIRWLLPIVAILIVVTILAFSPLLSTHAAGVTKNSHTTTTTADVVTSTPTVPVMLPDKMYGH